MRKPADPVAELFDECRDSSGVLNEELIRCALASSFRRGYEACLQRIPVFTMDHCPVRPAQWPVDEAKVAALEIGFRTQFEKPQP